MFVRGEMGKKYVLGIDEGTTSVRSVIYDMEENKIVGISSKNFQQKYSKEGWASQDAEEIFDALVLTFRNVLKKTKITTDEILCAGLTNQRETVVAWDKRTAKPICDAIVWQCRRTAKDIEALTDAQRKLIKEKTGLVPDPYFSASKMAWIMKNVPAAKKLASEGNLCFGTIDCFIAYKLTGRFVTDYTNASRTMLFNINTLEFDSQLLKMWGIERQWLPEVVSSSYVVGKIAMFGDIPLASIIGDQQASLVGNGCLTKGQGKITYGTGGFMLLNIGDQPNNLSDKLLTTIAYSVGGKTIYALEGSMFSACSAINWACHNMKLFSKVEQTEEIAKQEKDNGGVYFVPAFTGLAAPIWNPYARACFVGINFTTNKNHLVRAVLESLPLSTALIVEEMKKYNNVPKNLKIDGGASKNGFILQFLADVLGLKVEKSYSSECTVMGAIYLAMVACGKLSLQQIEKLTKSNLEYNPNMSKSEREKFISDYKMAVQRSDFNGKV